MYNNFEIYKSYKNFFSDALNKNFDNSSNGFFKIIKSERLSIVKHNFLMLQNVTVAKHWLTEISIGWLINLFVQFTSNFHFLQYLFQVFASKKIISTCVSVKFFHLEQTCHIYWINYRTSRLNHWRYWARTQFGEWYPQNFNKQLLNFNIALWLSFVINVRQCYWGVWFSLRLDNDTYV